jgi:hypothetical protein
MVGGIGSSEAVLRRYSRENTDHFIPDELGGTGRLTSGFLAFDADEDGLVGCSNYQASALDDNQLPHIAVTHEHFPNVAKGVAGKIRMVQEGEAEPFDVIPDYWPPGGRGSAPPIQIAHVLVVWKSELSGKAQRRARSSLAKMYQPYL